MKAFLLHVFYRYGWDTRSRNWLPARLLRPVLKRARRQNQPTLLDVGCGYPGLASFLPETSVAGIDLEPPPVQARIAKFHIGSIMALPFGDSSFPVVSCIDVLEHLAINDRPRAVRELVRVASRAVLIACPHGAVARKCDDDFRRASESHARAVPDWLNEHLQHTYPIKSVIAEQVEVACRETGRSVRLSWWYCEPASITRLVRFFAARSELLYAGVNVLFGLLLPLWPLPSADNSYRMVMLAELAEQV